MVLVARLAENETIALSKGIRGEDDCWGWGAGGGGLGKSKDLLADGGGLAVGQFGYQARGTGFAADAAFDVFGRRDDSELVARFVKKLAPSRRATGEDEMGLGARD